MQGILMFDKKAAFRNAVGPGWGQGVMMGFDARRAGWLTAVRRVLTFYRV